MAVSLQDVRVSGLSTEMEVNEFGTQREMTTVYYQIGEFGPYSVRIPKLELTAQRTLVEVRQDAQKLLDILNLQF
jgi:hypothetical protein